MNKDILKKINWVGVGSSILAFLCVFFPFCTAKVTMYGYSVTSESVNFFGFNVMGKLFMLAALAAAVLYFLGCYLNNKTIDLSALIVSGAALLMLIIAIIIGNSDIKDLGAYSSYIKVSYSAGMYLEFIFAIIMVASKWLDEFVVKKYIIKSNNNVYDNQQMPYQGQYMNQQMPQQGQYMNQQMSQQGQYMNQQAPQQGQYMNQQMPQQGQNTNQQMPQQEQYMNQQAPQQGQYMNQQESQQEQNTNQNNDNSEQ